jgi:hypothetical protein
VRRRSEGIQLSLRRGVLAAAGVVCGVLALAAAPTWAASPRVVISPLSGTPDANPATQVSFLGVPARDLRDVEVHGSASGAHSGRLEAYSTGTGASFLPDEPFDPGEQVSATATVLTAAGVEHVATHFTVATPVTLTTPGPNPVRADPPDAVTFHSVPGLKPSAVAVTTADSDPSAGDIFVAPNLPIGQAGPMILAPSGQLVYFKRLPSALTARDTNVQSFNGQPVLTWWQGQIVDGHGQGVDEIYDTSYRHVATVRAGNGLLADLHDFEITPQGTAWITAFAPVSWNLSPYGGASDGVIDDGVIQEIDIKTGLVMFQWDAIGHVAIADTYMPTPTLSYVPFDFFHVNSIDPQPDGDVLISSRNTWGVYLISGATGAIIWRLGGKHSTFTLGAGVHFAWQHDARLEPNGTITIFDNENTPREAAASRAIDVSLDTQTHSATLVWALTHPLWRVLAASQGSVQLLGDGDTFVGWGQNGPFSEFSPSGQLLFDMHFLDTDTYRAYRYQWSAQPLTRPSLVASNTAAGTTQLYVSWNGATDVASWSVFAGASPTSQPPVGNYPATGFETAITLPASEPYVAVQALSATGAVLKSSNVVRP